MSGSPAGGIALTVIGSSLGTVGSVSVGGKGCPVTSHGHSQIVCTLPSGVGTQSVVVAVSGQTRNSLPFTYLFAPVPSAPGAMRRVLTALLLGSAAWRFQASRRDREM
jgi:hypothetical protein